MRCPVCVGANTKHTVNVQPGGVRTLMLGHSFYDEDNRYHNHDPNTTTSDWSCSWGHRWSVRRQGSCWCGWGKKDADIFIYEGAPA